MNALLKRLDGCLGGPVQENTYLDFNPRLGAEIGDPLINEEWTAVCDWDTGYISTRAGERERERIIPAN